MMRRAAARVTIAAAAALCVSEAPAQFDFFGDDPPRPSATIPGGRSARESRGAAERKAPRKAERKGESKSKPREQKPPEAGARAAAAAPPAPYEPQMTRLAEVLGALTFLRNLCAAGDSEEWRAKMSSLVAAEGSEGGRREKLVGAFNAGFHGYELTYRVCTPNARAAITRYLDEAGKLARDITYRYGSP